MAYFEKIIKEDLERQLGLQVRDRDWSKILDQVWGQISIQISYQVEIEVRNNFGGHRNDTF